MSSRSLESYRQVCLIRVGAKICRTPDHPGPKLLIPGLLYVPDILTNMHVICDAHLPIF